ncbi:hypothetical protein NQP46_15990 [Streptomyces albus]|nr:hypothetical protein NQP46_15990 [Streptomyces albus]
MVRFFSAISATDAVVSTRSGASWRVRRSRPAVATLAATPLGFRKRSVKETDADSAPG